MPEQVRSAEGVSPGPLDLVGQWRARLQFRDGPFSAVDDLEFMYVFNVGGTKTGEPVKGGGDAGGRGVRLRF